MSKLLFVTSSVFGDASKSRALAEEFVHDWRRAHHGTQVATRDVSALPHVDASLLQGLGTAPEGRTAEQLAAVARAEELIAEVEAADVIVIAAPMYNFAIASGLKAWIDHIARSGRTFRYTAAGPEGLLKGKQVFVVEARGGIYTGDAPARAMDFQEPYLRAVLGFLGLDDVRFIHLEGLAMGPEASARGLAAAQKQAAAFVPQARAA
jgi:FMN-dependent NADH-azoreductase